MTKMNGVDVSAREHEVARGERAKSLLQDPLFKETLEGLKEQYLAAWKSSPANMVEGREQLYQMYKAAVDFEHMFKTTIDTGKLATVQLNQDKQETE
jgi:hypothetical protein